MRRTKTEAHKTKTDILLTSITVFNEKGYMRTRLEDIARAAGVTRGAVYHHFSGKPALFKEAVELKINDYVKEIEEILVTPGNPVTRVKNKIIEILKHIEADPFFASINVLISKTVLIDELKELNETENCKSKRERDLLIRIFRKGKQEGFFSNDIEPELFTTILISAIDGLLLYWQRNPEKIRFATDSQKIIEYIFAGVETA